MDDLIGTRMFGETWVELRTRVAAGALGACGFGLALVPVALGRAALSATGVALGLSAIVLGAAAIGVVRGRRWARWLGLGGAFAAVSTAEVVPAVVGVLVVACLSGRAFRARFERGWERPVHALFRWAAIATVACVPGALLEHAGFVLALAAGLMLAGRVVGVPLALAALGLAVPPVPWLLPARLVAVGLVLATTFELAPLLASTLRGEEAWLSRRRRAGGAVDAPLARALAGASGRSCPPPPAR